MLHGRPPDTMLYQQRSPGGRPARTLGQAGGVFQWQLLHPSRQTHFIEAASWT